MFATCQKEKHNSPWLNALNNTTGVSTCSFQSINNVGNMNTCSVGVTSVRDPEEEIEGWFMCGSGGVRTKRMRLSAGWWGNNGGEEMEAEYIFPFLRFDSYEVHFECREWVDKFFEFISSVPCDSESRKVLSARPENAPSMNSSLQCSL
jgi:hypothetical protein